jgi:hypothetical protein
MGRFSDWLADTVLKYSFPHREGQIFPAQQDGFEAMRQPDPRHEIRENNCPCEGTVGDEEIFWVCTFLIQQGGRQDRTNLPGRVDGGLTFEAIQCLPLEIRHIGNIQLEQVLWLDVFADITFGQKPPAMINKVFDEL